MGDGEYGVKKSTNYSLSTFHVAAGDRIRFVVEHNSKNRADPIVWDPVIVFQDGRSTPRAPAGATNLSGWSSSV